MKMLPENAYGLLLTFDGYDADSKRCTDIGGLYQFLYDLPEILGMQRLGFPHIVTVDTPGIRGLSAFTFIIESHISIHTYSERGFVSVDVYSCKTFDVAHVVDILQSYFKTSSHTHEVLVRGKHFGEIAVSHPRQRKRPR